MNDIEIYKLFKQWCKYQVDECNRKFDFDNEDYSVEFNRLCKDNKIKSDVNKDTLLNYYNCMEFANNNFSSYR